jgi:4-hydroxyproline epimerase
VVKAEMHDANHATIENVPSYRLARAVPLQVESCGKITGDVAWGGNWFFLTGDHGQEISMSNVERLADCARRIRAALARDGITGAGGQEIDHVELFGPPARPAAHSRNFVLCPGGAYDRSPCGTGTSARLACLAADGKLGEGEILCQESIAGSVFEAWYRRDGSRIVPSIRGAAYVNAEAVLILDPRDPFCMGIRA